MPLLGSWGGPTYGAAAMDFVIPGRRTKILLALILVMISAILELYIEAIRVSRLAKINIVACSAQHLLDT